MQQKWSNQLPISTTVMPITEGGIEYYIRNLKQMKRQFFDRVLGREHALLNEPKKKAKQLGYEE